MHQVFGTLVQVVKPHNAWCTFITWVPPASGSDDDDFSYEMNVRTGFKLSERVQLLKLHFSHVALHSLQLLFVPIHFVHRNFTVLHICTYDFLYISFFTILQYPFIATSCPPNPQRFSDWPLRGWQIQRTACWCQRLVRTNRKRIHVDTGPVSGEPGGRSVLR